MRINLIQEKLMATIEIDGVKYVGANLLVPYRVYAQGDLSRPTSESKGRLMVTIEIDGVQYQYVGANSFAQGDLSRPTSESRGG
ncbi:hypothetical protein [Methylobacter sp.]|uniref:hypothetical protein n=1 Tax=Methylobacter sp. TaxID=2051955 RepID=UPI003DA69CDB